MLNLLVKNWKLRVWCSLFHSFHGICKISNVDTWTAKHLAQASCTELTSANVSLGLFLDHQQNMLNDFQISTYLIFPMKLILIKKKLNKIKAIYLVLSIVNEFGSWHTLYSMQHWPKMNFDYLHFFDEIKLTLGCTKKLSWY